MAKIKNHDLSQQRSLISYATVCSKNNEVGTLLPKSDDWCHNPRTHFTPGVDPETRGVIDPARRACRLGVNWPQGTCTCWLLFQEIIIGMATVSRALVPPTEGQAQARSSGCCPGIPRVAHRLRPGCPPIEKRISHGRREAHPGCLCVCVAYPWSAARARCSLR